MSMFGRLVGLRMWGAARALDLQGFQFGTRRSVPVTVGPHKGSTKTVGEFALHLQCAWEISQGGKILVSHHTDAPSAPSLLARLFAETDRRVSAATSDADGRLRLRCEDGLTLEAWPFEGDLSEAWRLFQPSRDEPHLVFPEETE